MKKHILSFSSIALICFVLANETQASRNNKNLSSQNNPPSTRELTPISDLKTDQTQEDQTQEGVAAKSIVELGIKVREMVNLLLTENRARIDLEQVLSKIYHFSPEQIKSKNLLAQMPSLFQLFGRLAIRTATGRDFPTRLFDGDDGYSAIEIAALNNLSPDDKESFKKLFQDLSIILKQEAKPIELTYTRNKQKFTLSIDALHIAAHIDELVALNCQTRKEKNSLDCYSEDDANPASYKSMRLKVLYNSINNIIDRLKKHNLGDTIDWNDINGKQQVALKAFLDKTPAGYKLVSLFSKDQRADCPAVHGSPQSPRFMPLPGPGHYETGDNQEQ